MTPPRVPSQRIQPIPGLLTPFTPRIGPVERMRNALLGLSAVSGVPAAQGVYAWAVRDELAPLFAGSPVALEPILERNWLAPFVQREALLPGVAETLSAASAYGVSVNVVDILDAALKSALPQRRLSGWCALLSLCALNRTDL